MARDMYSVRLNPDALERVKALAEAQERTVADVMRRCLARGLADEERDQAAIAKRR